MKLKSLIGIFLVFALIISACAPAFAYGNSAAQSDASGGDDSGVLSFIKELFERISAFFRGLKTRIEVRREGVKNTMNQNTIHMLKSATDTIGDSFIITTEDGKVIAVDGGHYTDTEYFVQYLKAVTGSDKPHIDAWFLSHPHDDHCEVFLDVVENRSEVSFDKVYANFPETAFYEGADEWAVQVLTDYYRLLPRFEGKTAELTEGDVFNVGAADFTVFYTFNPEFKRCNSASTIMRMDLGGTSVMFTGDAWIDSGNYVVEKYANSGLLDCDICKMAHHGNDGVDRTFYEAVSPRICLWPTPSWVWENTNGNLTTPEVRAWMDEIGVEKNYVAKDGSRMLRLFNPRIVTTTDVFEDGYPADRAIDRLAALGYEGIDMGFDYWTFEGSPFMGDDYLGWAQSLREHADETGIPYTHAHSPGEANSGDVVGRSIEAAAVLGAKYCVVHPVWRDEKGDIIKSKSKFISVNAEAISEWLPKAEECGVILLSENVLWGASADPRIVADLVKEVDSPWFGWCFDVGHAWCSGYKPDILKKCSVVPLSLHIQDNDGGGDGHLIPGDGTIDWDLFIRTLKDVGYTGDCVMEAHHQSLVAPDEERDAILARLLTESEKLRIEMI